MVEIPVMLPRKAQLSHWLFIAMGLCFCCWVWLISPSSDHVNISKRSLDMQMSSQFPPSHLFTQSANIQKPLNQPPINSLVKDMKSDSNGTILLKKPVIQMRSPEREKIPEKAEVHTNQTLEQLKHNMTMLKANMSGIRHILDKINNSVDYSNLSVANPHPFKYVINTESVCIVKDLFMIAYIHTAPDHYKRRMVIRQTWGNPKFYRDVKMRVVFVMGVKDDKSVQDSLLFEAEQYNDIVQEDFMDTYKNLTYKGIAALKWISTYCRNAKYVLKSDDDIFINTFTLIRHLQGIERTGIDNKGLLLCLMWTRMKVMREGKWRVGKEEFAGDYYPTYCSGSAFTLSTDAAINMHNVSYHVPFFWVDDFYITGLLPLKLNGTVKHKQFMSTYVLDGRKLEEKFTGPQWFTYVFSHVHDLNAIQSVWEKLVSLAQGRNRPQVEYALPGQLPDEAEIRRQEKEAEEKKAAEKKAEEEKKKKGKS